MRISILIVMILFSFGLNAQMKVKIKKNVISVDGNDMYKFSMRGNAAFPIYTVSSLKDKEILVVDQIMHFAYFEGPRKNYFKVHSIDQKDSCLVEWHEANSRKKIFSLIINDKLLLDGKLNSSAFQEMRGKYNQDFILRFLKKHELSYDKLISRNKDAVLKLQWEDSYKANNKKKYSIKTGEGADIKTVGYMQSGFDYEIKKKFYKIFLPNGLEVARINPPETRMRSVEYVTKKDSKVHDTRQSFNKVGFLKIINDLSKSGYL